MRKIKLIGLGCILLCLLFAVSGCAKEVNAESWAYIHEPEVEILRLGDDGKASFKGKAYEYSKDEQFLTLTDDNNQVLKMRCVMKNEKMLLYETTTYRYAGEGEPDGIMGFWSSEENSWAYEFTEKGTFLEDGVFPGHYLVDEEEGTIKLMYNDHFEDTYVYYLIDGDQLIIEYPWPMVKTETNAKK